MRIIAGRFKGHRLPSPRAGGVRPTSERVREAVFSALGTDIYGARVLDLFVGTGAFGFEALSRGASEVVFVDRDPAIAVDLVRTAAALSVEHQIRVTTSVAGRAVKELVAGGDTFGIIFLDPPYQSSLLAEVMCDPLFPRLLDPEGLLVVEREARAYEMPIPAVFSQIFTRKYGGTMVEFFESVTAET